MADKYDLVTFSADATAFFADGPVPNFLKFFNSWKGLYDIVTNFIDAMSHGFAK